jgi:DNA processing protein
MNILTISKSDKSYPSNLDHLYTPPKKIHVRGGDVTEMTKAPVLAVVGSRKVSPYGKSVTNDMVSYVAARGIVVISGLALGVDSLAHQATLDAGGRTIAVLPGGIQKIYPTSHKHLAERIVESGGTLLSEYPGEMPPMKHHFIERNRIIAALCDALLITEAAAKSGSLHTARFALELGKTVAVVPGSIYSPTSTGCNNLIKMGALPVTCVKDLLECLALTEEQLSLDDIYYPESKSEEAVLELLKKGTTDGSKLMKAAGMKAEEFRRILSALEVKGVVSALGNDQWRVR